MSYTEAHAGTLKKIVFPEGMIYALKIGVLKNAGHQFSYEDYKYKQFECDTIFYSSKFDEFYEIKNIEIDLDGSLHFENKADGVIEYGFAFYNGGAGFEEVMDYVIEEARSEEATNGKR
jgi:hypothetical protein